MDEKNNLPNANSTPAQNPAPAPISNQTPMQNPNPAPVQTSIPSPSQPVGQTVIVKKSSPWPWVISGCLLIIILAIASFVFLGWWGARKVRNEIRKYEPTAESIKNNFEEMSEEAKKEAEEWEKKSKGLRESMPDVENFSEDYSGIK